MSTLLHSRIFLVLSSVVTLVWSNSWDQPRFGAYLLLAHKLSGWWLIFPVSIEYWGHFACWWFINNTQLWLRSEGLVTCMIAAKYLDPLQEKNINKYKLSLYAIYKVLFHRSTLSSNTWPTTSMSRTINYFSTCYMKANTIFWRSVWA